MKPLLMISAVIEMGAALALAGFPSAAVALLLGSPLQAPAAVALGRVAGAALLALGVACWLARMDEASPAGRGLVAGMLLYNTGAVAVLASAGACVGQRGFLLWPAVVLHAAMAVWCITCLRRSPLKVTMHSNLQKQSNTESA